VPITVKLAEVAAVRPVEVAFRVNVPSVVTVTLQPEKLATPLLAVTVLAVHESEPAPVPGIKDRVTDAELVLSTVPLAS